MPTGRQAEARRNDTQVLEVALREFSRNPGVALSTVARMAGVGQATLYRRYPNRQALMVAVGRLGLARIARAAREAVENPDPRDGIVGFLAWYVDSGTLRTGALLGEFDPPEELFTLAHEANADMQRLVDRAVARGQVRTDATGADLTLIATLISGLEVGGRERTAQLRRRYLELALQGLTRAGASDLPGPAPDAAELERPWEPPSM